MTEGRRGGWTNPGMQVQLGDRVRERERDIAVSPTVTVPLLFYNRAKDCFWYFTPILTLCLREEPHLQSPRLNHNRSNATMAIPFPLTVPGLGTGSNGHEMRREVCERLLRKFSLRLDILGSVMPEAVKAILGP